MHRQTLLTPGTSPSARETQGSSAFLALLPGGIELLGCSPGLFCTGRFGYFWRPEEESPPCQWLQRGAGTPELLPALLRQLWQVQHGHRGHLPKFLAGTLILTIPHFTQASKKWAFPFRHSTFALPRQCSGWPLPHPDPRLCQQRWDMPLRHSEPLVGGEATAFGVPARNKASVSPTPALPAEKLTSSSFLAVSKPPMQSLQGV